MLGLKLLNSVDSVRLEDVDIDVAVALTDVVDKLEGLLEVVEGVEEDKVDGLLGGDLGEDVDGDESGKSEGGGLVKVWESDQAPLENG